MKTEQQEPRIEIAVVRCRRPVELFDEAWRGEYAVGQVIEGEKGNRLARAYPEFFERVAKSEVTNG